MSEELNDNGNAPNQESFLVNDVLMVGIGAFAVSGAAEIINKNLLSRDSLGVAIGTFVVAGIAKWRENADAKYARRHE